MRKRLMESKKGQFYLLAAIIIIVLISGFAAISNYAKKKSSVKIYDIKEELGIEGGAVLEYGVYTGNKTIEDFISQYQEYAGEDKELYFVFGNETDIWKLVFEEEIRISTDIYGTKIETSIKESKKTKVTGQNGRVDVDFGNETYPFQLEEGENFFFVISQEIEGEKHIVTG